MKKFVAILLSVLICISLLAIQSYAAPPSVGELTYYKLEGTVLVSDGISSSRADIRFKYFDTLTSRMVESNGLSTCTSTALVDRDYTYKMVSAIKRSKDGK